VDGGGALMPLWSEQWLSRPQSKQQFNWKSGREENQKIGKIKKQMEITHRRGLFR
jgi:hypothetical protein